MTYSVRMTASAAADFDELLLQAGGIREKYELLSGLRRKIDDLSRFPELYQRPKNEVLAGRGYRFFALEDSLVFYRIDAEEAIVFVLRLIVRHGVPVTEL